MKFKKIYLTRGKATLLICVFMVSLVTIEGIAKPNKGPFTAIWRAIKNLQEQIQKQVKNWSYQAATTRGRHQSGMESSPGRWNLLPDGKFWVSVLKHLEKIFLNLLLAMIKYAKKSLVMNLQLMPDMKCSMIKEVLKYQNPQEMCLLLKHGSIMVQLNL